MHVIIQSWGYIVHDSHTCIAFVMFSHKAPKNIKWSFANACAMHDLPDCKGSPSNSLSLAILCKITIDWMSYNPHHHKLFLDHTMSNSWLISLAKSIAIYIFRKLCEISLPYIKPYCVLWIIVGKCIYNLSTLTLASKLCTSPLKN